jgi:beta-ketoacyl-acyl-carrier-protein synthase II
MNQAFSRLLTDLTAADAEPVQRQSAIKAALTEIGRQTPTVWIDAKEARRADLFELYGLAAAKQAVKDANFTIEPEWADQVGVVIGSAVGGHQTIVSENDVLRARGIRRMNVFTIPMVMSNGAAGMIAIELGAHGPSYSPASACATSNDSIGQAFDMVRWGRANAMITGGADATVALLGMAGFAQLGALSPIKSLPAASPRPFDKDRDGVVVGEGAVVFVIEELEFAKQRGARILAEIAGYGQTTDAYHMVAPAKGGAGAARAIKRALDDASVQPSDIDYINAHGTATPLNDISETQAIKTVFGEQAYKVPISSTKSMTGHMMGVAGAVESAVCIYAINNGIVPPTINLQNPDPECDLDYVPGVARKVDVRVAMNNSFGFGGHNSVLIYKRYEP